jgi:hypothetical protein
MVADVSTLRKFVHKKEQAIAPLLSQKNMENARRAVGISPKHSPAAG